MTMSGAEQSKPPSDSAAERVVLAGKFHYVRAPVPVHFPAEAPLPESKRHLLLRTLVYQFLEPAFAPVAAIGCDQLVYWDPTDPGACLAPDAFVHFGDPDDLFSSWKVWERGAPHLAIEVVSASDARDGPWERKLQAYRRSGVVELARFDPEDADRPLRLWDRVEGDLVERAVSKGELELSEVLGLFWLVEPDPELGLMLRLTRAPAGLDRLLTDAEGRQAAEARVRELEAELARRSGR